MNCAITKYICVFFLLALVTTPVMVQPVSAVHYFLTEEFSSLNGWNVYVWGGGSLSISSGKLRVYSAGDSWATAYSKTTFNARYPTTFNYTVSLGSDAGSVRFGFAKVGSSVANYESTTDWFVMELNGGGGGGYWINTRYRNASGSVTEVLWAYATNNGNPNNFCFVKDGSHYLLYDNDVLKYNGTVSIPQIDTEYCAIFAGQSGSGYTREAFVDYLYAYTDPPPLYITANTAIEIFTPVPIDSISINIISQILKIFVDACKTAVVVGNIIAVNIIDTINTVIKIGQSVLTIIAQSATYIYSGLITIIDKVVVTINSFNALIDSIITTFETLYDEDTVYGSIIRVIPLILLLSIPTIVVYYKIGDFATIPMFMFMSIVAYMTSLMPLWILVVALIGCITILIQKQRRSN